MSSRDSREQQEKEASRYEPYYPVDAEGWRIGLAVCKGCGCVVLMGGDGADQSTERHDKWHRERERDAE